MKRKHFPAVFQRLARHSGGATAIEYGLLLGFIAIAIVASLGGLGNQLQSTFSGITSTFSSANAAG